MSFDFNAFGAKLAAILLALSTARIAKSEHVVRFLRKFGYERLKGDFETLYVHALVMRRFAGTPPPLLKLFKEEAVVGAFQRAWKEGDREPFNKKARWAIQTFADGDEVRSLDVNVEEEVRKFFDTFDELVTKARSPGDQRADRLLQEIHETLVVKPTPTVRVIPTEAQRFQRDLGEWLEACGYVRDRDPEWIDDDTFDLVVDLPRRRGKDRYLVRGFQGVADAGKLHDLPQPGDRRVDESWLVSPIDVAREARAKADEEKQDRFVYTFDDLIDEVVRLDKYEAYLRHEVERRKLPDYYVPLRCRRPQLDREGVARAEGLHESLEEFVDRWLEQPVREHMSILGEFGMGKTWFTLRLAYNRLQAYHQARHEKRPRGRYPLLIQLRDYAKAVSVKSLLSEFFFDRFEVGLPSMKAFNVLNRMERFLLIFDGFDEMQRRVDYQMVVDNFWKLAKAVVPGAKAVLTCRDEHFRYEREAREVLAGKEMASTTKIVLVPPRFDVVHIEPFDEDRIREAIIARQGKRAGKKTADLVLSQPALADLARRPVMIEMVLSTLDDIKGRESLATSQVYLFATDAQMRRNIKEERTFTSMTDKVLFLCELAWEMHRTETLKINYKLFPDHIRRVFGVKVAEEEKDHWHFDLMAQTLLVRDAEGNYSFAHRGLVEYFSAYRLLARAGALAEEFVERYRDHPDQPAPPEIMEQPDPAQLHDCWGAAPFHPNLVTFLAEMGSGKDALLRLIDWTKGKDESEVGFVGGNAATVLIGIDQNALAGSDLRGASLRQASLAGADLGKCTARKADLRGADLMATDLTKSDLRQARLGEAKVSGLAGLATLACDASGEILFGGPRDGGWVYDLARRRFIDVFGRAGANWTANRAVSDDGRWLAYAHKDHLRVGRVDPRAGPIHWQKSQVEADVSWAGVAWHPAGWFLVISYVGVYRLEPSAPPRVEKLTELSAELCHATAPGVAVCPPWWFVGSENETSVWDEGQQRVVASLPVSAYAGERPEVSPAGDRVSIANQNGLFVFDTRSCEQIGHVEGNSGSCAHGWSPKGTRLAFCVARTVLVVDASDLQIRRQLQLPGYSRNVAFHGPDELIVVDDKSTIHLYDLKTGDIIFSAPQVPPCDGANFRGATGLDDETRKALKQGGARV